ncbi:heterokaryon incompatibility protein-domain-containing protein [Podospora aff. communis PSN243]|uniref:Heterokaryon incompatibility protein-domain-containing protein n=1 Tax=Podospora aff. communis PSN243 TaxID=3040156 RepID=A0AAV9H5J3_9PEZI|nr:heterokaryon incompatibility protein-domain-containing protein [Podospora aff. communis PSN243]
MAPSKPTSHSCKYCQGIFLDHRRIFDGVEDFCDWTTLPDFSINNLQEGDDNGCRLCRWILDGDGQSAFQGDQATPNIKLTLRGLLARHEGIFRNCCLCLHPNNILEDILHIRKFGLWDTSSGTVVYEFASDSLSIQCLEDDPAARFIRSRPINTSPGSAHSLDRVSTWLEKCQEEHQGVCSRLTKSTFMPSRLVEVLDSAGQSCLRLTLAQCIAKSPYIPLSYCWGGDQPMKSEKKRVAEFMEGISYEKLPRTLQDAVTVCRHLRVRYLWVDAICIIQDDEVDKTQQIAQMPTIYKNGYLTIIAGSASNTAQGFLGDRLEPHAETLAFDLSYRCPDDQIGRVTLVELNRINSDPLDSRAWALQERLLSPRTLEFSSHQIRWLCPWALARQDPGWYDGWCLRPKWSTYQGAVDEYRDFVHRQVSKLPLHFDDPAMLLPARDKQQVREEWRDLVTKYTFRNLTNPEDRILAFSGVANEYAAFFRDAYLAGLWRSSLLQELLWYTRPPRPTPTSFQGPSWSWTSRNGIVYWDIGFGSPLWLRDNATIHSARLVHCNPMLVEKEAPFGAVEQLASSLVLEARLLPAILSPPTKETALFSDKVTVTTANDFPTTRDLTFIPDTSDLATRCPELNDGVTPLMLLEMESFQVVSGDKKTWHVHGLVLRRELVPCGSRQDALQRRVAEKGECRYVMGCDGLPAAEVMQGDGHDTEEVFNRVGAFQVVNVFATREVQNVLEEDAKELHQAWRLAATERDWFKNCVPRNVTIL